VKGILIFSLAPTVYNVHIMYREAIVPLLYPEGTRKPKAVSPESGRHYPRFVYESKALYSRVSPNMAHGQWHSFYSPQSGITAVRI
jgi:hypothetical protein